MRKLLISILSVALGAALIYGATMAWFTDEADVAETTFTAGTVNIEAEGGFYVNDIPATNITNVNPGDDFNGIYQFQNGGTKKIKVRVIPTFVFTPADASKFSTPITNDEKFGFIKSTQFKIDNATGIWTDTDLLDGWTVANENTSSVENSIGLVLYYEKIVGPDTDPFALPFNLSFQGAKMDNKYQGCTLVLGGVIQAVQASHNADDAIGWSDITYNEAPAV